MSRRFARLSTAAAGTLAGLALVAVPAHAVPSPAVTLACAPDPYEIDDAGTGAVAPIQVGGTVHRAICQGRDPLPGKSEPRDVDWFDFTAVEGQSYTVEATDVGAGLVDNADRGGLSVGFEQINPDGTPSGIIQSTAPDGDRSTTLPLHAGRYLVVAATGDQQVYPEDNVLATKTVQGSDGVYGIKLTATAPAPVLKSLKVSPNPVKAGDRATATLVFTAPLLAGGSYVPVVSSDGFVAAPGGTQVAPGGATSWTVPIDARSVSKDTTVTISAQVSGVGPTLTTPLTVRK
ncbi:hypothetical protein [Streptomyces sp. NBC_01477]|uniref:hypothetical protein n=1 Tax=Streptomyces sp. NBC_01477 TaxID=2976015 RepID=UPI002E3021E1|nr:hypothetical protein [Streptomyces sp. NBC_01477]